MRKRKAMATVITAVIAAAKTPAVLTTFCQTKIPMARAIKNIQRVSRFVSGRGLFSFSCNLKSVSKIPAAIKTPKAKFKGNTLFTIPSCKISKVPRVRYNRVAARRISLVMARTKI